MKIKGRQLLLFFLILSGFAVRLYRIRWPVLDWHSWRQVDTSSVARNFVSGKSSLTVPVFDDLSNIPSGKQNPQGYRFVEFPIFNFLHAQFFQLVSLLRADLSLETTGRLTSVIASLVSSVFLYLITAKLISIPIAFLSMAFFLFLPYNVFYSRTILPEPTMVMFSLISIYFLVSWQEKPKKNLNLLFSAIFAALAILVKPYSIFLLAPSALLVLAGVFLKEKQKLFYLIKPTFYLIISCLPFVLWRFWMKQFPEGIPVTAWLFNGGGIRFRPAWWRWLFAERLSRLILGYWGLILFGIGLITKTKKKGLLFFVWLFGIFVYFTVFARGNVQHDYYQILAIPVVSVFLAKGTLFLANPPKRYLNKFLSLLLLTITGLFTFGFSWYYIHGYYQINRWEIVGVGKLANQILPKEARIIAPYGGDTSLLYYTNRPGWPSITQSVAELVGMGATHYLAIDFDQTTEDLKEKCLVLEESENWVIIDLRQCREELL